METYSPVTDIDIITSAFPIPGYGLIPVNAFLLKGQEPLLIDTGAVVEHDDFMTNLKSLIDPEDLRWIWLTHTDFDHIGSLKTIMEEAPEVRLITTFRGVGIMSTFDPLPMDRVNFVNPGETITIGDRTLTGVQPPVFDNPSTTGLHDSKTGIFFSSDCFGALLQEPQHYAEDISAEALREGQTFWAAVDSPWVHKVDARTFGKSLEAVRKMEPKMVMSSHLPPAQAGLLDTLLDTLSGAPTAEPFVGPDQAGLEAMLKEMTEGAAAGG